MAGCTGGIDSGAVAFRIAPRLNAAGRLADATPPLDLLLTEDARMAMEISQRLHDLNGERQDVERRILEDALAQVERLADLPRILVLSGCDWHEGVVGIVASRLVERYNRPAILLSVRDGVAKGSGRSIAAYDLVSGLNACAKCSPSTEGTPWPSTHTSRRAHRAIQRRDGSPRGGDTHTVGSASDLQGGRRPSRRRPSTPTRRQPSRRSAIRQWKPSSALRGG